MLSCCHFQVNLETSTDGKNYTVYSMWDPNKADLEVLNTESPPGLGRWPKKHSTATITPDGWVENSPWNFVINLIIRLFTLSSVPFQENPTFLV